MSSPRRQPAGNLAATGSEWEGSAQADKMKRRGLWAGAVLSLAALATDCAAPRPALSPIERSCPPGSRTDPTRLAALHDLLQQDPEATQLMRAWPLHVCFVPGSESGVISGEVALLAASSSDRELAPRLLHLLVHRSDQLGDGCAVGLAAAQRSEHRAVAMESRLRELLGAPVLVPKTDDAQGDYLRRCGRP